MRLVSTTFFSKTLCLGMLTLATAAGGCNSSSDSGGGSSSGVSSGVSKDKPAEEVTASEAEAVCEAVNDYAESKLNSRSFMLSVCKWAAASAIAGFASEEESNVDLGGLCDLAYDACVDCVDNPNQEGCEDFQSLSFTNPESCTDSEAPENCDATVGEIESCYTAQVDLLASLFSGAPSCSQINEDNVGDIEEDPFATLEMPAECEDLADACPEIAEE